TWKSNGRSGSHSIRCRRVCQKISDFLSNAPLAMEEKGGIDVCSRANNNQFVLSTLFFVLCSLFVVSWTSTALAKQSTKYKALRTKYQAQEHPMVQLIPSQDSVMQILKKTGAFRE